MHILIITDLEGISGVDSVEVRNEESQYYQTACVKNGEKRFVTQSLPLDQAHKIIFDAAKDLHDIVFCNFEHTEKFSLVTIAGVSSEPRFATISGQGSRTMKFLLYHFKERIAKYSPDMLILILGGNDMLYQAICENINF